MQVLEVKDNGEIKMVIDKGVLQQIYDSMSDSDIRQEIGVILTQIRCI